MKNFASLMAMLVAGVAFYAPAQAQPALGKKNCETVLDADKVTDDQKSGQVAASGNAIVTQCDVKMRADTITYDRKAQRATANGHIVVVSQKSGIVSGDSGVYDVPKKLITLTGRVVLKQGGNVLEGTHGTYNVATGIAQIDAAPTAPGAAKGRVRVVLPPEPAKEN